jgi:uncharacterized protein
MTPQERSLLESFLAQLVQVRSVNQDPEAQRLIERAVEQQPDATYLVVQRALLLNQALEQAKVRIAALEQAEAGRDRGFLDPNASGWGNTPSGSAGYRSGQAAPGGQSAPVGQPAPAPQFVQGPQYVPAPFPGYGVPPAYGAPPGYAPAYAPAYGAPPVGGGFSSFLGQAAATAAGVAGGEFLFQGIENMFGHHGGGGFGGGGSFGGEGFGGGFGGEGFANAGPTEDLTINNYYGPEEVIVENNDFDSPQSDDSDGTISNDGLLGDDQEFI